MLDQLLSAISPYLNLVGNEPWKQAALILVTFIFLAWALGFLINTIIGMFASHTKNVLDEHILQNLHRPLIWTIFLVGLIYAAQIISINPVHMGTIKAIIASIVILLWSSFAIKTIKLMLAVIVRRADKHSLVRAESLPLFNNLIAILIYTVAIFLLFQAWKIDMTAWLASAGVIGIAVGFAAKDTLANLISGVFIMADTPYKIGDYVVLDDNASDNSRGKITHIGIRSTRMLTRDDVEVTIPNSIMGNSKVVNQTGGTNSKFRIRIKVGVAYGTDTQLVEEVLLKEAEKESIVCKYPVPRVRLRTFGTSSLDYQLLCWIETPELRGRATHHLNTNIYKAFQKNGIEIPYAKQDVYIKSMPRT